MNPRTPDFDELVGKDVPAAERERLRAAHDLLVRAGPPPELSPELARGPRRRTSPLALQKVGVIPRRSRWLPLAAAAAAIAVVAFLAGTSTSRTKSPHFVSVHTLQMHGTALAPNAEATVAIGRRTGGNWPMLIAVTNLPAAPGGGYYDLWMSHHGKPVALCGSFNTFNSEAIVHMSAAYGFRGIDGWIVTRELDGVKPQVVMTT
jgi:hypothetical protein